MRPMWPGESRGDSAGSNCGAPNGPSRRGTKQFQDILPKQGLRTRVNPALRSLNQLGLRKSTRGSYRRTGGSPRGRASS